MPSTITAQKLSAVLESPSDSALLAAGLIAVRVKMSRHRRQPNWTGQTGPPPDRRCEMVDPARHDVQLLLDGFDAHALRGLLLDALERMESGGTLRILEAMFLASDVGDGLRAVGAALGPETRSRGC